MSDFFDRIANLSPKRLALLAVELHEQLEAEKAKGREPIAVISLACRFPGGADTPEAFWQLLRDGIDAIDEVPKSRWDVEALYDPDPDAPGKIASRWGGFIEGADRFEPQLFGISPREAVSMDPQQRLLLEAAWETFERAGYAPDRVAGTNTGVFVGVCNGDYYRMLMGGNPDEIDMYLATGNAHSVASGRVSYVFGLHGPSLSIDTACSSSLVAVADAVASLRAGACRMALAGGVNMILSPDTTVALSRARMLATDGRCKAFDAAADGFVRSEGCGLVLLKRLSDAQADGDPILAVLTGVAVNQDGRSSGLTAPNGPAQAALIREAVVNAGIDGSAVGYVETHGTGTSLGDPIEFQALGAALCRSRDPRSPLLIGSVKTNLGHLESAAGIAGLIKAILVVQRGEIPPHLHFKNPSPHIPWADFPVQVPTRVTPWPGAGPRVAGVSSFGFSGTNAHILVAQAPEEAPRTFAERPEKLLVLSARTQSALVDLAQRYQALLDEPGTSLADVAFTASHGRSALAHRAAVVAPSAAEASRGLRSLLEGSEDEGLVRGEAVSSRRAHPQTAFLFTGQGAQYPAMGKELYETEPTFRAALDKVAALFAPHLDRPLLEVMWARGEKGSAAIEETKYAQPANFAIQVALVLLWRSWGIEPTAVVGHSAGEFAAAWTAGLLSLEDAASLVATRSRLMQGLAPGGAMGVVMASEPEVLEALRQAPTVSLASLNGPESSTISGPQGDVEAVLRSFESAGTEVRRISVRLAAHSPIVDPVLDPLEAALRAVMFHEPRLQYVSGLEGRLVSAGEVMSVAYWRRHTRQAVRFAPAIADLHGRGYTRFVEIGPHPTLLGMARRCLPEGAGTWLPSLRSGQGDWKTLMLSLGQLFVAGGELDWKAIDASFPARPVPAPTYPFERERYWTSGGAAGGVPVLEKGAHPLLGRALTSPALKERVFENRVGIAAPAFLNHHRLFGVAIMPSPAYVEMALGAAESVFGPGAHSLQNLVIREALVLPDDGLRTLQLIWRDEPGAQAGQFEIVSRVPETDSWTVHAAGRVERSSVATPSDDTSDAVKDARGRCTEEVDGDAFYDQLLEMGLEFGASFHGIDRLWRAERGEAVGTMRLPEHLVAEARAYRVHPALLDSCFHLIGATLPKDSPGTTYLLVGVDEFIRYRPFGQRFWNHTALRKGQPLDGSALVADVRLYDEEGLLLGEARGLLLRKADRDALLRASGARRDDWLYEIQWHRAGRPSGMRAATEGVALSSVATAVAEKVGGLAAASGIAGYEPLVPELEALATSAAAAALVALGWQGRDRAVEDEDAIASALGVVPQQRRLFGRLIELAAEDPVATAEAGASLESRAGELTNRFASGAAEIALTARCGRRLAEVLRGQVDPLGLLFPGGSLESLEAVYRTSPPSRFFNGLVREAVEGVVSRLAGSSKIRVVEIGAGTGATTAGLLGVLPAGRTEYTFTDVSPAFLSQARVKFAGNANVRTQVLDIEKEPGEQGLAPGSFDVAIAANVLHATADLGKTLDNVRRLLAPGGVLVLLEGTSPLRWVDVTFGMTEGWWRFTDTLLRPHHPIVSRTGWKDLLGSRGFGDIEILPGAPADSVTALQAVILARNTAQTAGPSAPVDWVLVTADDETASAWADELRARGDSVTHVSDAGTDALTPEAWDSVLAEAWSSPARPRRAVYIAHPRGEGSAAAAQREALRMTVRASGLARALARRKDTASALWLVTKGAQATSPSDVPASPSQAVLWGLGRVIALELPAIWGGLVDVSPLKPASSRSSVIAIIAEAGSEDQVAIRGDATLVPRLSRRAPLPAEPVRLRDSGVYLVTGGLGGVGLNIAGWLADKGARDIVLLGRRGLVPGSEAAQKVQALEGRGVKVEIVAADVTDFAAMSGLLGGFDPDKRPLRGIFHAAAALGGVPFLSLDEATTREMLRPKVEGTWLLHEFTKQQPLDFFVLFSSTTALWGSRDLAHYAAANAFLDSFAHQRRGQGLRALSINWGTWDVMRVASAEETRNVAQHGLRRMASRQALDLMGDAAGAETAQVVVADVDFRLLKATYEARRVRPMLSLVGNDAKPVTRPRGKAKGDLVGRFQEERPQARRDLVVDFVKAQAREVLGVDPGRPLDVTQGLFDMGMDSLMSVELKTRLETAVRKSLPSTLTFNHPSVAALSDYLIREVLDPQTVARPGAVPPPGAAAAATPAPDLSSTADLTEDELVALLGARLDEIKVNRR